MESRLRCKNGTERWVTILQGRLSYEGREACILSAFDISARKLAEEKLRRLAYELTQTEDTERRRMANVLHDVIGQSLSLAYLKTRSFLASERADRDDLEQVQRTLEELISQTRALTFELCPPILYELRFHAALEWLVDSIRQKHSVRMRFECVGDPHPEPEEMRVLLFQAARELMVNSIKHADAECITITLQENTDQIVLLIVDDGKGFDADSAMAGSAEGFGLFNIRERLEHVGAAFAIRSAPGEGTSIRISVPADQETKR